MPLKSRPASPRALAASRANAQKSTGPKTPEGKARSAQNAVRHGLCAKIIVLLNENDSEYQSLFTSYVDEFHPAGPVELHLVEEMVTAAWRARRALEVEANALDEEMESQHDYLEERYGQLDSSFHRAKAFTKLSTSTATTRLDRYQASMSRQYHRALKALLDLRKRNPPRAQQANLPNKPNPISEQSQPECGAGCQPAADCQPAAERQSAQSAAVGTPRPASNSHAQSPLLYLMEEIPSYLGVFESHV